MAHSQLTLSNDELLSTTRAVRKRLDFDREVSEETLAECLEIATQAPTASNSQGWQFVFVTDKAKRARIAELYQQVYSIYREMPVAIHKLHMESDDKTLTQSQTRSASSADYLAENLARVPAFLIPCVAGRTDHAEANNLFMQAPAFGSVIPAAWSFMLAARARGIGTAWTTLHLMHEKEIAELLGIPYDDYMQVALIPIAYTRGTDFKPAYRPPVAEVMHVNAW